MNFATQSRWLAYAGTLPFIYCALAAWSLAPFVDLLPIDTNYLITSYAVIILSFLAGMHWIYALEAERKEHSTKRAIFLLLNANLIALWAWGMWGLSDTVYADFGLAFAFTWMLWLDAIEITPAKHDATFWQLRRHATTIAISALLLTGVAKIFN